MNTVVQSLKQHAIVRFLFATCLVAVLFLTTACNSGNEVGARPQNPPVQMGGQNNPHKGGGDGYTQFNTDRKPVQNLNRSENFPTASDSTKTGGHS
jgi:hypothetical protein